MKSRVYCTKVSQDCEVWPGLAGRGTMIGGATDAEVVLFLSCSRIVRCGEDCAHCEMRQDYEASKLTLDFIDY